MDNVTHAIAGFLLAEGLVQLRRRRGDAVDARYVRAAWWTSALANNLPDSDLVYTAITPGKIGYMLHHRGHTHTVLGGLCLAVLLALIVLALLRRSHPVPAKESRALWSLALLGPLVHMTMDGWNSYGVHPFWPIDARWFYGDTIFILEPLLWAAALPALYFSATTRVARGLLALLLGVSVSAPWLVGSYVPVPMKLGVLLLAALSLALARVAKGRRVAVAFATALSVFAVFAVGGRASRDTFERALRERRSDATVRDVVRSPLPANPLCWDSIAVLTTPEGGYVLRRAMVSSWPALWSAERCPAVSQNTFSPTAQTTEPDTRSVRFEREFHGSLSQMRALAAGQCEFGAFLRFSRAPTWSLRDGVLRMGDLRFDREAKPGFSAIETSEAPSRCPTYVPSWVPPRSDVLRR